MFWLQFMHKTQRKTGCISQNPGNSYGLAALTPNKATSKNRMQFTEPQDFLWFECIHTSCGYSHKQNASHRTLGVPMVWLQSHQLRLQRKRQIHLNKRQDFLWCGCCNHAKQGHKPNTRCMSSHPRNSDGLAALTPNKATMKNRMHFAEPSENKATTNNGMHLTEPQEFLRLGCTRKKQSQQN